MRSNLLDVRPTSKSFTHLSFFSIHTHTDFFFEKSPNGYGCASLHTFFLQVNALFTLRPSSNRAISNKTLRIDNLESSYERFVHRHNRSPFRIREWTYFTIVIINLFETHLHIDRIWHIIYEFIDANTFRLITLSPIYAILAIAKMLFCWCKLKWLRVLFIKCFFYTLVFLVFP